ncbi:MAG TPA: MFS transporter [Sporichthyaceae bacterium]|nr:MFS transporter [Sporichthyaceae bacterium]
MINSAATTGPDAGGARKSRMVLVTACLALFMSSLDNSVANVALPAIGRDLHAGATQLQWVIDSYIVVRGALLLTAGALSDRYGRRRMFQHGLLVFGAGSLLCSLATSPDLLVSARVLQATGGCFLVPSSLALVTDAYPDTGERARAIGIWSATTAVSTGLGPPLGGMLVELAGWRSVFWINVPLTVMAVALAHRHAPAAGGDPTRRLDLLGQSLVAVALFAGTSAFIESTTAGWTAQAVVVMFVVAAAATAAFAAAEARARQPLLPLGLFRDTQFSAAAVVATTAFVIWAGFLFVNTLYLQDVRGYSPLTAGLLVVPATIGNLVLSPLSGRLTAARGPCLPVTVASIALLLGSLTLVLGVRTDRLAVLVIGYVLVGSGAGLVNAPITNAALAGLPRGRAGVAGGVTSMFRQVGNALGVALFGTLALSDLAPAARNRLLAGNVSRIASGDFVDGLQAAYLCAAGFAVLTLVAARVGFRDHPQEPAQSPESRATAL